MKEIKLTGRKIVTLLLRAVYECVLILFTILIVGTFVVSYWRGNSVYYGFFSFD